MNASENAPRAAAFQRRLNRALAALVAVVTLSVFSVTYTADFVPWDDDINIYGNPHIRGITAESLKWMFTDTTYVHRYMPVGWLALAIDYQLASGLNPTTYHAGNLLLHTINAVLVFLLIGQLLRKAKPAAAPISLTVAAFVGALFWSIHPLRAEPVAWSSARIYHVAMFFVLTSVLAYLKFQEQRERKIFYGAAVLLFALSALTYPITLAFPVALLAMDVFPLRRWNTAFSRSDLKNSLRPVVEKLPFFVVSALVLAATLWNRAHATRFTPAASLDEFGLLERAAQASYVWAAYLWKTCWPANLCPTYTELLEFRWWEPRFIGSFLLIGSLTVVFLRRRERWPAAVALWISYLALLLPMAGLTEHPHYVYDRYSLIVGVLFSIALAWLVVAVWQSQRARAALLTSAAVVLAVFGAMSFAQAGTWRNTHTFLPNLISKLGDHPVRAKQDLVYGVILMTEKRSREAENSFRNALRVQPDYAAACNYLGDVLTDQNKFEEAAAAYRRALNLKPTDLRARQGLGVALGGLKQFDAAVAEFEQVLLADAKNANAMHNLAVTLDQMGKKELAMAYFQQAQSIRLGKEMPAR